MDLDLDRSTLAPGQTLHARATVYNAGFSPVTYQHRGCPPERIDVWVDLAGRGRSTGPGSGMPTPPMFPFTPGAGEAPLGGMATEEPLEFTRHGTGNRVPLYPYGGDAMFGTCAIRPVTLAPGERLVTRVDWNGQLLPGPDQTPHGGPRAPPGTYTLVARLVHMGDVREVRAEAVVRVL